MEPITLRGFAKSRFEADPIYSSASSARRNLRMMTPRARSSAAASIRSLMSRISFDMSLCQSSATTASGASRRRCGHVDRRRRRRRQLVDIVEDGNEDLRRRNDPLGDALGQAGERRLLAVHQEHAALNRAARRDPARELGTVGMAGIFIDAPDPRRDLDFLALDAHGLGAIVEETPERALRLKADQQHRCVAAATASA